MRKFQTIYYTIGLDPRKVLNITLQILLTFFRKSHSSTLLTVLSLKITKECSVGAVSSLCWRLLLLLFTVAPVITWILSVMFGFSRSLSFCLSLLLLVTLSSVGNTVPFCCCCFHFYCCCCCCCYCCCF